jgi:hypothetical protein
MDHVESSLLKMMLLLAREGMGDSSVHADTISAGATALSYLETNTQEHG